MSNKKEFKLVSIGIPVFNGDAYLSRCVKSILKQSYPHIEVVISDNCSDDDTMELCQRFAVNDERVRYIRQNRSISMTDNFRFCLENAIGRYFAWVAHDDWLLDSDYITKLVNYMELNPDVVCATSDVRQEDSAGYQVGSAILSELRGDKSWQAVSGNIFAWKSRIAYHAIYGLFRREVLLACPLELRLIDGTEVACNLEIPFLAKIVLVGRIVSLPFEGRVQTLHQKSIAHAERACYHWKLKGKIDRAYDLHLILLRLAFTAQLSILEKTRIVVACIRGILRRIIIRRTIVGALRQAIKRLGFRVHRVHSTVGKKHHHGTFDSFVETHFSNEVWQLMPKHEKETITFYQPLFAAQAVRHVLACGLEEVGELDVLNKHYPDRQFYFSGCHFTSGTLKSRGSNFSVYRSNDEYATVPATIGDGKVPEQAIIPVDLLIFSSSLTYHSMVQWIELMPSCQAIVVNYPQSNGVVDPEYQKIIKFSLDEGYRLFALGPQVYDSMLQTISGKILLSRI